MAFAAADLVLLAHGKDKKLFYHDAANSSDTLATVNTAGYYNNTDDAIRMTAKDLILVNASDGEALLEVASVAAGGDVTTGVSSLANVTKVETASTAASLSATGLSRLTATASKTYTLSAPFAGAVKALHKSAASTKVISVNAGAGVTFDGTNDDITFNGADDAAVLIGVSATRWVIVARNSIGLS